MDFQEKLTDHETSGDRRTRVALVTCAQCGCRLRQDEADVADGRWYHFAPIGGRDARGCRIECADAAHDWSGAPLAVFA